jgi:hypothetical protein
VTPLLYLKLGAIIAMAAALLATGYHIGSLSSKTALEADHAAQLQAVVNVMDENARQAAADHAHQQGVIDAYHATPIDPLVAGAAHRVYVYAASASGCGVPQAGAVAGGAQASAPVAFGPSEVERALDDYIQACSADAAQMNPMIALAP